MLKVVQICYSRIYKVAGSKESVYFIQQIQIGTYCDYCECIGIGQWTDSKVS